VLESITTDYSDKLELQKMIAGIGTVEGNTFVIRDGNSVLLRVFPFKRCEKWGSLH